MQGSLPNHTHSDGNYSVSLTNGINVGGGGQYGSNTASLNVSGNSGNPNSSPNFNVTPSAGNMNNGNWRPAYVEVISCSKD